MKLLTASVLIAGGLATTAFAAPSSGGGGQLVFNDALDNAASVPSPSVVAGSSHREPDFVDIMEAEAAALAEQANNDAGAFWPPVPTPTPGGGWVWSSCGQPDDVVEVKSIDVSPDPPVPGKNMTVKARGIVKSTIKEGSFADVSVKIGVIRLLQRKFDLCEEARKNNADVQCPVEPGEYDITQTVELPREIPPAKFNVHVVAVGALEDKDGGDEEPEPQQLTCLDLSIDFRKRN